ncbi:MULTISPECIES: DUF4294 domain-containing protein [Culturomica]|jgi:hypothetical protein|uniref:DUF4294 domain-containing protein n=1 Tax=Culturomica TaxID=1926651 RepID=UPI000E55951E|nr:MULTISPECIES: DUF4294 domain-containing protein [Odoribacteraceae]RHV98571.1 DUF4294 domain-containing protein [Odoribacter sp. OF09-27XD]HBO25942.1 DUF4294 domain-containing protein [Culturomica sp.]
MVRIFFVILWVLFYANALKAQQIVVPATVVHGDTLPHLNLEEVNVFGKKLNKRQYRRYTQRQERLEYNVRKVYPYAQIAARKIREIDTRISTVSDRKKRKQIIKEEYGEMMKTFKKPLMKLTITQGRILIRLIYRETNNSAFAHIKEYKGSVNAYFWQSLALLFGNNLKADYEPYGKDADIEEIVLAIRRGE